MSDMIERVAQAIHRSELDSGEITEFVKWETYLYAARAAIEAMREPADDQRNAYYELSGKTEVMMDAHWERAIDAAMGITK